MELDYERVAFLGDTLGVLFSFEPREEAARTMIETFQASDAHELVSEWPFGDKAMLAEGLKLMCATPSHPEKDAEDMLWEYRRLFMGPGHVEVPPWGSVYTDRECVVFGLTTLELREWMRAHGIAREDGMNTPEDHIGKMLFLLSWIARNKPELLTEYLQKHLLTWACHMLEIMRCSAQHDFYRGLALVAQASLEGIQNEYNIEVTYPRFYK